jgi:hypothetical protein
MTATIQPHVSIEDYLHAEERGGLRYEYDHGKLIAMPGGSLPHTRISSNAFFFIQRQSLSQDSNCDAFNSELKIEITSAQRYVYADAAVVCGGLDPSPEVIGAVRNPRLVIEVVSASSQYIDYGRKKTRVLHAPQPTGIPDRQSGRAGRGIGTPRRPAGGIHSPNVRWARGYRRPDLHRVPPEVVRSLPSRPISGTGGCR